MASEAAVAIPAEPAPELAPPVPLPPSLTEQPLRPGPARHVTPGEGPPHIALLLPLKSRHFGRHAEAVRSGFQAAAKVHGGSAPPVRVYPLDDDAERTVETYIKAINAGARAVVGPLTRDGVAAVMGSAAVVVPTLALNVPEGLAAPLLGVYMLSLQIDAEARQVAQLAYQDGLRRMATIADETPLLKRIHQAFVDEFTRLGGTHTAAYAFTGDPAALTRLRKLLEGVVDGTFLALDFARARLVRPYMGNVPVYATSQVNPGDTGPLAGFDLAGVRFLDMPWLLQPEHAAVMVYPRPTQRDTVELERFYALGIDAYRIALTLLDGRTEPLDGVTGRLTLGHNRQFTRALTAAQFTGGKPVVRERQ